MGLMQRLLSVLITLWVSYLFIYWIPFAFLPIGTDTTQRLIAAGCAFLLGFIVWQVTGEDGVSARRTVLKSTLWVGGVAFLLGFVGPMLLVPDANQGPLLGFFTGPVGAFLGAVFGLVRHRLGRQGAGD